MTNNQYSFDPNPGNMLDPQPSFSNKSMEPSHPRNLDPKDLDRIHLQNYINASQENQKKIISQVLEILDKGYQARKDKASKWVECDEAYFMAKTKKVKEYEERNPGIDIQILSWLFEIVETISTELIDGMLPSKENFFAIKPQVEDDEIQILNAEVMEKFLKYKVKQSNFLTEFPKFLKQLIIRGNSVARVYPQKVRKEYLIRKRNPDGTEAPRRTIVKEYICPQFETFDIHDFVIFPLNVSLERSNIVQRVITNLDEVKSNSFDPHTNRHGYINTKDLKSNATLVATNYDDNTYKEASNTAAGITTQGFQEGDHDQIELLEYWGRLKVGDKVYDNIVITIANRDTLLKCDVNPFGSIKPFIFTGYTPIPNQIYSIGPVEVGLNIWKAATKMHNLTLMNAELAVNHCWTAKIGDDALVQTSKLSMAPGRVIPVEDHDTFKPLQQGGNLGVGFTEIEMLKKQLDAATAATDQVRGAPTQGPDNTATSAQIRFNQGSKQFARVAEHINQSSLLPILKLFYLYVLEYAQFDEIANATGTPIEELNELFNIPLDEYQVNITGLDTTLQKAASAENFISFIDLCMNTGWIKYIDPKEGIGMGMKINDLKNPEGLLLDDSIVKRLHRNELLPFLVDPEVEGEEILDMPDIPPGMEGLIPPPQ